MDSLNQDQIEGRRESFGSHNSQTAKEYGRVPVVDSVKTQANRNRFIESQLQLEAEAREALPYVSNSAIW